jgi:hypothetical protein
VELLTEKLVVHLTIHANMLVHWPEGPHILALLEHYGLADSVSCEMDLFQQEGPQMGTGHGKGLQDLQLYPMPVQMKNPLSACHELAFFMFFSLLFEHLQSLSFV